MARTVIADREGKLEEAVVQFGEAWARGDIATLDRLLSPTYTHTDAFGELLERDAWLDYARNRTGRSTKVSFVDIKTRFHNDIAIVTGANELSGRGISHADDRAALRIRFTQIWIWHEGKWLREAFQATPCRDGERFA